MEIKKLKDIQTALDQDLPEEIAFVDSDINLYDLAGPSRNEPLQQAIEAIKLTANLEKKYCQSTPARSTKQNPHKAISLIIRAANLPEDFPGYETAMNNLFFSLETLCRQAAQNSIWLLIENPPEKLLISPLELRDLIDSLSSPWIRILFNENNINHRIDISDYRNILGQRIAYTI